MISNLRALTYLPNDGNGNVSLLADASDGSLSAEYDYSPFGQTLRVTDIASSVNLFTFSTKYQDAETEFFYYGFRYYNSETGSWPNRDPIEEEGGVNQWDVLGLASNYSYNSLTNAINDALRDVYDATVSSADDGQARAKSCS